MATASQPLTKPPFDLDATLWGFVTRELSPTPGRLAFAVRIATAAVTMLLIGEACHSETLFVALFTPLLLPRETPQQTWAATKGTIIIVWGACAGAIVLVLMTAELPWARMSALAFGIFVCMILSRALHQPSLAALGPVTLAEVLIRMDSVNSAEASITAGLWMALMMSVGCLVATAVDFVFPHAGPQQRITKGIVDRLKATALVLRKSQGAELSGEDQKTLQGLSKLALAGTSSLRKLLPAMSTQPSIDRNYMLRLSAVLNGIDLLSDQAVQLLNRGSHFTDEQKSLADQLARSCLDLADHVQRNVTTPPKVEQSADPTGNNVTRQGPGQLIGDMSLQMDDLWTLWSSDVTASKDPADQPAKAPPKSGPFVTADDVRFAVKVTLACAICYVIYNGVAWQGISTALVTCFFVADTTIGGTFRKLALRIAGVLVGGLLLGIGGIALITSHMDNVFELMLYVAMVYLIAGWVTKGSPRISYAGSQIAISYSFAALMTTQIASQIVQPRDRLVGILLGTIVMWFVFTRLWPVDALRTQKQAIAGLIQSGSDLSLLAAEDSPPDAKSAKIRDLRESINQSITKAEDQADMSDYESKDKRGLQSALRKCLGSTQDLLMLEMAQVDLSIRSAHKSNAPEAFDKEDARRTADFLCLLAKQMVDGTDALLSQLREKEQQLQAAGDETSEHPGDAEKGKTEPHQAVANASTHIRSRRNGLLANLFHAVEEVNLLPREPQPQS